MDRVGRLMVSVMQQLGTWRMIHLLELLTYIDRKILKPDGVTMEEIILEFETYYSEYFEKPEEKEDE